MDITRYDSNPAVRRIFSNRKYFHAYIISGPAGSGKWELAMDLAAAMMCENREKSPCEVCDTCRKVRNCIHPDVYILEKEKDKKEVSVDIVRQMRRDVSIIPNEADTKVYIVPNAAELNAAGQNAILKILEEPPAYARFIMICENPMALLETIRSRAVLLSLSPVSEVRKTEDELKEALEFLECLSQNNKVNTAAFVFSLEKMDKLEFGEFVENVITAAADMLKDGMIGNKTILTPKKLLKIIEVFEEIRKAQELNLGIGHLTGLILSELV